MNKIDKFKYTNGEEFTFEGSDYIGYYNIFENNAYRTKLNQDSLLVSKNNISSLIELEGKFYDRNDVDDFTLEYDSDGILFQPNEYVNKNSINSKIELLYENFKVLYNFSKISSPNVPGNFANFAVVSAAKPAGTLEDFAIRWVSTSVPQTARDTTRFGQVSALSAYQPAYQNQKILLNTIQSTLTSNYTLFTAVSNSIFAYNIDQDSTTFSIINSAVSVGTFESLTFGDIVSIDSDNFDTLYISDSGNNSLYQINVSDVVNRDRTGNRKYVLKNVIGGEGDSNLNFGTVDQINFENGFLFAYDRVNKEIKQFNNELNFIKKFKLEKFFNLNTFLNFAYNIQNNYLYVLFTNYKVLVLDVDTFNVVDEYQFNETTFTTEIPKKIIFSKNNSNIYYLLTDKGLYKYFVNKKNRLIGRFNVDNNIDLLDTWQETGTNTWGAYQKNWDSENKLGNLTNIDITLLESDKNYDRIILLANQRFLEFLENENLKTLLSNENPDFINLKDILLKDEYFNNITFNNLIYKFLFNLTLLGNEISKKIKVKYENNSLILDSIRIIDSNLKNTILDITDDKQFYVGVNETASTLVFNRVFTKLNDYLKDISSLFKVDILNTRIPSLSTVTFK